MSPVRPSNPSPEAFFKQVNRLLDFASETFEANAEANPDMQTYYLAACLPVQGVRSELAGLQEAVATNPLIAEPLSAVLVETGATVLLSQMATKAPAGQTSTAASLSLNKGLDLGKDVFAKASSYLPYPFDKAAKNVGELLGIIGKISATSSKGIKGLLQEIQKEVTKIEMKAERLGSLTGHRVVDASGAVVPAPDNTGYKQSDIPGSLLWMVWQNQFKLEHLWRKAFGDDIPTGGDKWIKQPSDLGSLSYKDKWFRDHGGQFGLLAYKIDKLADLLGRAIVDSSAEWDPEPELRLRTVSRDSKYNMLPKKSVKQELHDIEDLLRGLRKLIQLIINIDILDIDIDLDINIINIFNKYISHSIEDNALKRIYVYDEGVFHASSARSVYRVEVRTKAFDLAGWIDLDDMRVGDVVRVDVYILLPSGGHQKRRRYRSKIFRGIGSVPGHRARRSAQGRGIHSLQDICGHSILVGDAIDIDIRQLYSARGYPSHMEIAYQFVVESR